MTTCTHRLCVEEEDVVEVDGEVGRDVAQEPAVADVGHHYHHHHHHMLHTLSLVYYYYCCCCFNDDDEVYATSVSG